MKKLSYQQISIIILLTVFTFTTRAQFNVGGNVSISVQNGLYADIAPAFGYRIKIVNFAFSPFFSYSQVHVSKPVYCYGARFFAQIDIMKGTFAHGEIEAINTDRPRLDSFGNTLANRSWQLAIPVGVGYSYALSAHATAYAIVLYDVIHDPASPKENPYIRVGINYNL